MNHQIEIGRLLRAGTTGFTAGCRVSQFTVPALGSLVRAYLGDSYQVYGLIYDIHIDDDGLVRQLVTADNVSEEVLRDNRERRIVPVEMSVMAVGYEQDGKIYHMLPPRPPLSLDVIYLCEDKDMARFTSAGRFGYFRHILHNKDVPAPIEEIARAYRQSLEVASREVPVSAKDFHGDGQGSEIAIVGTDRLLGNRVNAEVAKHHEKLILCRHHACVVLALASRSDLLFETPPPSARSIVSSRHLSRPLRRRHAGPLQALGLALTAAMLTVFAKNARHDRARNVESTGDGELRFPGAVTFDQVRFVDVQSFHGRIYNLDCGGWYTSNGIVVKNCRCALALTTTSACAAASSWSFLPTVRVGVDRVRSEFGATRSALTLDPRNERTDYNLFLSWTPLAQPGRWVGDRIETSVIRNTASSAALYMDRFVEPHLIDDVFQEFRIAGPQRDTPLPVLQANTDGDQLRHLAAELHAAASLQQWRNDGAR